MLVAIDKRTEAIEKTSRKINSCRSILVAIDKRTKML